VICAELLSWACRTAKPAADPNSPPYASPRWKPAGDSVMYLLSRRTGFADVCLSVVSCTSADTSSSKVSMSARVLNFCTGVWCQPGRERQRCARRAEGRNGGDDPKIFTMRCKSPVTAQHRQDGMAEKCSPHREGISANPSATSRITPWFIAATVLDVGRYPDIRRHNVLASEAHRKLRRSKRMSF
jgi:hypothetical protein